MDAQTAQQRYIETTALQGALQGMSDDDPRRRFRHDPLMALINQAHRARTDHDGGMNYMSVPF
ncbi:hypothetical protein [Mycobacterium servetii]|uniref:Uncharacterized protein n=1 Tax=Mycobacterium servetii TaxID=3237418 RepID=A0ABV4BY90_9MYCO